MPPTAAQPTAPRPHAGVPGITPPHHEPRGAESRPRGRSEQPLDAVNKLIKTSPRRGGRRLGRHSHGQDREGPLPRW
jgi:hypothetical protein